jgi:hypothetical protein
MQRLQIDPTLAIVLHIEPGSGLQVSALVAQYWPHPEEYRVANCASVTGFAIQERCTSCGCVIPAETANNPRQKKPAMRIFLYMFFLLYYGYYLPDCVQQTSFLCEYRILRFS